MNAIIIVARLESERLPQKHLQIVEELPLIKWLTKRIQVNFKNEIEQGLQIVIASPDTVLNKQFEDLYKNEEISIFRGTENNVPLRVMECSDRFNFKKVVIADGDNFLLSMEAIKAVFENLIAGSLMVKTEGLPLGMNVMGWDTGYLKNILLNNSYQLLETGWGRIFKDEEIKKLKFNYSVIPHFSELRFTTDYPEDLQFMKEMFHHLGQKALTASSEEIIATCISNNSFRLNGYLSKIYFENFYKKMADERYLNHEK